MYLSSILRGRRSKAEAEPGVSGRRRGGRRPQGDVRSDEGQGDQGGGERSGE